MQYLSTTYKKTKQKDISRISTGISITLMKPTTTSRNEKQDAKQEQEKAKNKTIARLTYWTDLLGGSKDYETTPCRNTRMNRLPLSRRAVPCRDRGVARSPCFVRTRHLRLGSAGGGWRIGSVGQSSSSQCLIPNATCMLHDLQQRSSVGVEERAACQGQRVPHSHSSYNIQRLVQDSVSERE